MLPEARPFPPPGFRAAHRHCGFGNAPGPDGLDFLVFGGQFYTGELLSFISATLSILPELTATDVVDTYYSLELLETSMKNTARNTLLITAAVTSLVAGAGLASAQGVNDRREAPAAAAHDQTAPEGKTEQQPGSTRQKSPAPTAQVPEKANPSYS
jgi:hypothetical protein